MHRYTVWLTCIALVAVVSSCTLDTADDPSSEARAGALGSMATSDEATGEVIDETGETAGDAALAVSLPQSLTAFRQNDGRIIVFARRTDNVVMYIQQRFIDGNGGWTDWISLGIQSKGAVAAAIPVNRLILVIRGMNDHLYYNRQLTTNSDSWGGWVDIGGVAASDPTVTANGGRVLAFVRGTDNGLWARSISDSGALSPPTSWLGYGLPSPGGIVNQPVAFNEPAVNNSSERAYVFVKEGSSATMHSLSFPSRMGLTAGTWRSHSGVLTSDKFAVGMNLNATLEVFARGSDGGMHHQWQPSRNGTWGSWHGLGLPNNIPVASNPAVGRLGDGSLFVTAVADDGAVYFRRQNAPASFWRPWVGLGGQARSHPATFANANGTLENFVVGTDRRLYHCISNSSGVFSGWGSVSAAQILL